MQHRDGCFPELPVTCIPFVPVMYMASLLSDLFSLSEAEVSAPRLLAPRRYPMAGWEKGKLQTQPFKILLPVLGGVEQSGYKLFSVDA